MLMNFVLMAALCGGAAAPAAAQNSPSAGSDDEQSVQLQKSPIDSAVKTGEKIDHLLTTNPVTESHPLPFHFKGYHASIQPVGIDFSPFDPNMNNLKTELEFGKVRVQNETSFHGGLLRTGATADFRVRNVFGGVQNPPGGRRNPLEANFTGPDASFFETWTRPIGRDTAPSPFNRRLFSGRGLKGLLQGGYFARIEANQGVEYDLRNGKVEPYYHAYAAVGKTFSISAFGKKFRFRVSAGPKVEGFSGADARFYPLSTDVSFNP